MASIDTKTLLTWLMMKKKNYLNKNCVQDLYQPPGATIEDYNITTEKNINNLKSH